MTVTVPVRNTGSVAGAEIVQVYVSAPESAVERPVKELKGFGKIFLEPGKSGEVKVTLDKSSISYFDAGKHDWAAEKGNYRILVGASSEDIRKTLDFKY